MYKVRDRRHGKITKRDHTEILRGKNRILVAVKKIKEMSYDQFLRFIFPERECLIILSCLISKKSRIG